MTINSVLRRFVKGYIPILGIAMPRIIVLNFYTPQTDINMWIVTLRDLVKLEATASKLAANHFLHNPVYIIPTIMEELVLVKGRQRNGTKNIWTSLLKVYHGNPEEANFSGYLDYLGI